MPDFRTVVSQERLPSGSEDNVYHIDTLISDFSVNEKALRQYIADQHIQLENNGSIPGRHLQTVMAFIEQQNHRIDGVLAWAA